MMGFVGVLDLDCLMDSRVNYSREYLSGPVEAGVILQYMTLPGLRPAAVAPPTGYARTAVGPGTIPAVGINELHCHPEPEISTPGIFTRLKTFFRDIAPGVVTVAGAMPQRTSKN